MVLFSSSPPPPPSRGPSAAVLLSEGILLSPTVGLIWYAASAAASLDWICNCREEREKIFFLFFFFSFFFFFFSSPGLIQWRGIQLLLWIEMFRLLLFRACPLPSRRNNQVTFYQHWGENALINEILPPKEPIECCTTNQIRRLVGVTKGREERSRWKVDGSSSTRACLCYWDIYSL